MDEADRKYHQAIRLTNEVATEIHERSADPSPFAGIIRDLISQGRNANPTLVADAFEAQQEAKIFRGLKNGD